MKFSDSIKLSNFLFAHDNIKRNLPLTLYDSITLVDSKHSQISRNQRDKQVNIPTVRTKTSGSNSIKSKSVSIWNEINRIFLTKQFIHLKRNSCRTFLKEYFIKGYV